MSAPLALDTIAVLVAPADGVRVLREVFRSLEGGFPGAIVILTHVETGKERGIADNLNVASNVMVHEAVAGMPLRNGHAYVVKPGSRLAIDAAGCFIEAPGPDEDALLTSLASRDGGHVLAVALTALGSAERVGFARVRDAGGHTFALDEADRLWADSRGPRVVPDAADELLSTNLLGPRLIALAA